MDFERNGETIPLGQPNRQRVSSSFLSPESVASRTFSISRRGFDLDEVRTFLHEVASRVEALEVALRELEKSKSQLAQDNQALRSRLESFTDEDQLAETLGKETSKILHVAHQAAGEVQVKSERAAKKLIRDAQLKARELVEQARGEANQTLREAQEQIDEKMQSAQLKVDAVIASAMANEKMILDRSRMQGREILRKTHMVRSEMLSDLLRQRKKLTQQIEQLKAGRDSLQESVSKLHSDVNVMWENNARAFDKARSAMQEAKSVEQNDILIEEIDKLSSFLKDLTLDNSKTKSSSAKETAGAQMLREELHNFERALSKLKMSAKSAPLEFEETMQDLSLEIENPKAELLGSTTLGGEGQRGEVAPSLDKSSQGGSGNKQRAEVVSSTDGSSQGGSGDEPRAQVAPSPAEVMSGSAEVMSVGSEVTSGDEQSNLLPETPGRNAPIGTIEATGPVEVIRSIEVPPIEGDLAGTQLGTLEQVVRRARVQNESAIESVVVSPPNKKSKKRFSDFFRNRPADVVEPVLPTGMQPVLEDVDVSAATVRLIPTHDTSESAEVISEDIVEQISTVEAVEESVVVENPQAPQESDDPASQPIEKSQESDDPASQPIEKSHEEIVLERRDGMLNPIIVEANRKIKRILQDEQNDLMDKVRTEGSKNLLELLGTQDEHSDSYYKTALDLLIKAGKSGALFSSGQSEQQIGLPSDLAKELVTSIVSNLRSILAKNYDKLGVDSAMNKRESAQLGAKAITASYREFRSNYLETVITDTLLAAFSRGTIEVLDPKSKLVWIAHKSGSGCPDCEDNSLAGTIQAWEEYPTGQVHPPAHSNCRCVIVQATS